MIRSRILRQLVSPKLILVLALAACGTPVGLKPATATPTTTPTVSPTPTVTPVPLAVSVNGEGIPIPEFEAEVTRYLQAQTDLGNTVSREEAREIVSRDFIDILLLAQAANAGGYRVDDVALQNRMDALASRVGGPEALSAWQEAHGYTEETFRSDLRRQMAAAHMRDQVAASVPSTAEQVHVRQILLYDETTARKVFGYLEAGQDFNDLAAQYDPLTKGELGWLPRGYLSDPAIEAVVFALEPDQYSEIIHTQAGYDILFLVERDPARPLSPDALLTLQERAVQDWLAKRRTESTIRVAP
jgi:parvulin-like peptidyl-prolyl isomerase